MKETTIICCIFIFSFFSCSRDKKEFYQIQQGTFRSSITETGELQAVRAKYITMPYIGWKYGWRYKIIGILEHGARVEKGDSLIQIDESNVMKFLIEQENKYETEKAALNKLKVEHLSKTKNLESELAAVRASYDLKKLELEKFKFESEKKKKVKKHELEIATVNLERTKLKYELNKTIFANELKIKKIELKQLEDNIKDAKQALTKLTLHSPITGIFQVAKHRRSRQLIKLSDEVYQGMKLASVPDMSQMRVESTVNETDINKIYTGQRVVVRLDAFPEKPFEGTINKIGKLSYSKEDESTIKVFDISINLNTSDPVLKPGMTVSCEIFTSELDEVLFVPNNCILKKNRKYYLMIKHGSGKKKQAVTIGPRNTKHTVIYGDFESGTRIYPVNTL
jgi:HlyD family secretion protein